MIDWLPYLHSKEENGLAVTFRVSWLCQAFDIQRLADIVLDGGHMTPHHTVDGFSQDAQVIEDLKGCTHLGGVLSEEGKTTQASHSNYLFTTILLFHLLFLLFTKRKAKEQSAVLHTRFCFSKILKI